jgi:3,4-dihydroxy 2-butanone 4-phosphate synthase/GTP cyclohydrolase II
MIQSTIDRARALIAAKAITKTGLAKAIGLHANSLLGIEDPNWNPTASTLLKLESWLNDHDGIVYNTYPNVLTNSDKTENPA